MKKDKMRPLQCRRVGGIGTGGIRAGGGRALSHRDCVTPIAKYPSPFDISYSLAQHSLRVHGQIGQLFHEFRMIASLCWMGEEEVDQASIAVKNASNFNRILVGYK